MPESKHLAHTESAFSLFSKSYALVKENLTIFIFVYSISALFALWNFLSRLSESNNLQESGTNAYYGFFSSFTGLHFTSPTGIGLGLALLLGLLAVFFGLLQIILVLRVAQGHKPSFGNLWEEFKKKGARLVGLEIMMGVGILFGFILLIVPGIILLGRWFLAPYILVDRDTPVSEALVQSWEMTKGYAWPIYSVILVGILWSLTGAIPLVGAIISFLLAVAYSVAPALRYRELNKRRSPSTSSSKA
jgi:uncharacterized membrane protein